MSVRVRVRVMVRVGVRERVRVRVRVKLGLRVRLRVRQTSLIFLKSLIDIFTATNFRKTKIRFFERESFIILIAKK